jgi:N6-adenosine-specific RNA methylase IME4
MKAHSLADLFPTMEGAEFEQLKADIKANKLREPIWLLDGKILDGRNRYRACQILRIKPDTRKFDPKRHGDPLAFIISMNLKRRHLDESQRAMIAARLATLKSGQRSDLVEGVPIGTAAAMMNVSERSAKRAAVVRDFAEPEIRRAVDMGKLAVSLAAQAAILPKAQQREIAKLAEDGRTVNAVQIVVQKARRKQREKELGNRRLALPNRKYGVIVADPEWKDEVWGEETGSATRAAALHYLTSDADVIASRDVASIAAKDCVLFLWSTNQHLRIAMSVLEAWGFEYKSNYVWGKDKIRLGRWNRSKHEIFLVGARGSPPCPALGTQWESLIITPTEGLEHSEKPEIFLKMIEEYYPTMPKIELNSRGRPRDGWDAWGNEVDSEGA